MMATLVTARTCSRYLRETARRLLVPETRGCVLTGKRYLLSRDMMKFDDFLKKKQVALRYLLEEKGDFFTNMEVKLQNSEAILDTEIKSILHLCESPTDVQFAKECLLRYFVKAETPEFKFGPVFLRLCYQYDLIDTAFELMMDKSYRGAFSDTTSFNILLEILHQHKQYEKALAALLEMKTQRVRFNKHTYLMAFASCYELNSPRSLETAIGVLEDAEMNRVTLSRVSLSFIVSLALKQGEYKKALHAYEKIEKTNYSLCCNLSVLIASGMEDLEKVLQILEAASEPPKHEFLNKLELSQEVMDTLEDKLKATDLFERFNAIYEQLKQSEQISALTVHEMLYASAQEQDDRKREIKTQRKKALLE